MANRLKNMHLTSVDLVRAGANQEANICLYKSADPSLSLNQPTEEERQIFKRFLNWLSEECATSEQEPESTMEREDDLTKGEVSPTPWLQCADALMKSISSIEEDVNLTGVEKREMMEQSLQQFTDAMRGLIDRQAETSSIADETDVASPEEQHPIGKNRKTSGKEGTKMKIDKSVFTPEELQQYEFLIAKARVEPEEEEAFPPSVSRKRAKPSPDYQEDYGDDTYEEEDDQEEEDMGKSKCKKSMDVALAAALERLERLEKSMDMKKFTEIAKKYAPLGEDETELAKTLYEMHQANEANYNSYIGILDKSLEMVEKSGLFAEIGKSTSGGFGVGSVVGKIEHEAGEIMKADASLTREQAIAKAWENNPALIAEYDAEYFKR